MWAWEEVSTAFIYSTFLTDTYEDTFCYNIFENLAFSLYSSLEFLTALSKPISNVSFWMYSSPESGWQFSLQSQFSDGSKRSH